MSTQPLALPVDRRAQQGGLVFLASLLVFFLSSIMLYLMYAYWRRDDPQSGNPLPLSFLASTLCMLGISVLAHLSIIAVRREKRVRLMLLLTSSLLGAILFMGLQLWSLGDIIEQPEYAISPHKGIVGMVIVLAVLHALHVAGGVIALGLVTARAGLGFYDHERFWAIQFTATYWHFLDAIWICMLTSFWMTSGGFRLPL